MSAKMWRQGDLVFESMSVSGDLQKRRDVLLAGRDSGGFHTLQGECMARQDGTRWQIKLGDMPAQVTHVGRHRAITLPAGWQGEVRPLRQGDDDRDVID